MFACRSWRGAGVNILREQELSAELRVRVTRHGLTRGARVVVVVVPVVVVAAGEVGSDELPPALALELALELALVLIVLVTVVVAVSVEVAEQTKHFVKIMKFM